MTKKMQWKYIKPDIPGYPDLWSHLTEEELQVAVQRMLDRIHRVQAFGKAITMPERQQAEI